MKRNKVFVLIVVAVFSFFKNYAQDLEPRAMTNLPVGTNFLLGGYGYSYGNLLLDPALTIDDLNSNIHSGFAAYVRSINLFGLSAKVDAILPYVLGDWEGTVDGENSLQIENGFGDLRLRFSFNYLGSKAMNVSDFKDYDPDMISGFSLQLIIPTGSYDPTELINIGSNRWVIKPQWGFAKNYKNWVFEGYIGMWFFTKNSNFLEGNELTQKPLYTFKVHVIRELPKNMWLAANFGYGIGGRTEVNEIDRDTRISTTRLGLDWAIPFAKKHAIKITYSSGIRFEKGPDFNAIAVSYQYRWNRRASKEILKNN